MPLFMSWQEIFTHYTFDRCIHFPSLQYCISGVMVSVLVSSTVDREFEPWSGQTKHYKICICCFSAKHAALKKKSKDWLAQNRDNVSGLGNMSTHGLLFQWASTIKIQLSILIANTKQTSSSSHWKLTCSGHDIKIAELALNNNHSLLKCM